MSELREFFRTCPACGRKFHIKVVSEKLVDERKNTENIMQDNPAVAFAPYAVPPAEVEENVPLTIDIQDFQYTYKCKHCGHIWSEMHEKESAT